MNKYVVIVLIIVLIGLGGALYHKIRGGSDQSVTTGMEQNANKEQSGSMSQDSETTDGMKPETAMSNSDVQSQAPETTTPANPTGTQGSNTSSLPAPATPVVHSFTVTGQNFSFAPSQLKVKKGDTVKITFKNSGGFHDLKIDEFNVATKRIASGAEETIQFIADKTGSFEYYCSVGDHRAMGMKGVLVVE